MKAELIGSVQKNAESLDLLKTSIVSQKVGPTYFIECFDSQQKQGNKIASLKPLSLSDNDKSGGDIIQRTVAD